MATTASLPVSAAVPSNPVLTSDSSCSRTKALPKQAPPQKPRALGKRVPLVWPLPSWALREVLRHPPQAGPEPCPDRTSSARPLVPHASVFLSLKWKI